MKALFVRCYGRLTADMMIGGLIDMGVPPVYLKSCLSDAGITADFMEKPNPAAQISAHYFHIFPEAFEGPLYMVSFMARWRSLCKKVHPEWEETGWKVFRALASGLPEGKDDLSLIGVSMENAVSLYLLLCCLDYLETESLFTIPFSIEKGTSEAARASLAILKSAGATDGEPVPAEDIHPFAAAILEGLSADFISMDGRFLSDKTAYGSSSDDKPTGDNTVCLYLGYYTDRAESVFGRHMKVFGANPDLEL